MTSPFADTIQSESAKTITHRIWMAGNYATAKQILNKEVSNEPGCFAISKTDYIYSGGEESGICVTLINYPRFSQIEVDLDNKIQYITKQLLIGLNQGSLTIEGPTDTVFITRRK